MTALEPELGRDAVKVNDGPFVSHAQNGEDVVLWRALRTVDYGTYIDVGANHPSVDSVSRSFYDHGWRGLLVEPSPAFADLLRAERPLDRVSQSVVSNTSGTVTLHMVSGTGLSTIVDEVGEGHQSMGRDVHDIEVPSIGLSTLLDDQGFGSSPIHFLTIDTEGAEHLVLESLDFTRHRPWILLIEATAPTTTRQTHAEWEPMVLAGGYQFCLFDGLSRFYVAAEHAEELKALLSYPACVFDEFVTRETVELRARLDDALDEGRGLQSHLGELESDLQKIRDEYTRTRRTLSWRITAPLRAIRAKLRSE